MPKPYEDHICKHDHPRKNESWYKNIHWNPYIGWVMDDNSDWFIWIAFCPYCGKKIRK